MPTAVSSVTGIAADMIIKVSRPEKIRCLKTAVFIVVYGDPQGSLRRLRGLQQNGKYI